MKAFKALKPFEAPQRIVKIKISVNFRSSFFGAIFPKKLHEVSSEN